MPAKILGNSDPIWDDLRNLRSLDNGYVPMHQAHPVKHVMPKENPDIVPPSEALLYPNARTPTSGEGFVLNAERLPQPYSNAPALPELTAAPAKRYLATRKTQVRKVTYEKPPTLKNWPPNVSEKALPLWEGFYTKYKGVIKDTGSSLDKQWACALAIWRNYCVKRNVPPFDENATYLNQQTQDYMISRFKAARRDLDKALSSSLQRIKKDGYLQRVLKEKMYKVEYVETRQLYEVSTLVTAKLSTLFKSPMFRTKLRGANFNLKSAAVYQRVLPKNSVITAMEGNTKESCFLVLTMYLTPQQAKYTLGLRDNAKTEAIVRGLGTFTKKMIKEAPLTSTSA